MPPAGSATPEGAAMNLIRAYIRRDYRLFNQTRDVPMCEGYNDPANRYVEFLRFTSFSSGSKAYNLETMPCELTEISKVYAARSFAPVNEEEKSTWAITLQLHLLTDQRFVDVIATGSDGREYLHRTVVEQHNGGYWTAQLPIHPDDEDSVRKRDEMLKSHTPSTVQILKARIFEK